MLFSDKLKNIIKNRFKIPIKKITAVTLSTLLACWGISSEKFTTSDVQAAGEEYEVVATSSDSYYMPNIPSSNEYSGEIESENKITLTSGNYKFTNTEFTKQLQIADNSEVHIWLNGTNKFNGEKGNLR